MQHNRLLFSYATNQRGREKFPPLLKNYRDGV